MSGRASLDGSARWSAATASKGVGYVFVAAAVLGTVIGLDTLILHLTADPLADVRAYYDAGARLNAGLPLYAQSATTDDPGFYRYPPLLAVAFRPLAMLPFDQAALIWEALLIVAFAWTLCHLGLRRRWTWLVVGWLAAPLAWSLAVGQAQVLVTLFLTLGSPLGVALAAHLKLTPVLVGIYWASRRDRRAVLRLAAWIVLLALLSLVVEPRGTMAFLTFTELSQVGDVINLSPYALSPLMFVVIVVALGLLAWRLASTPYGWIAAVALVVFSTPRLLMYQLSTLLAAAQSMPRVARNQHDGSSGQRQKKNEDRPRPRCRLPPQDAEPGVHDRHDVPSRSGQEEKGPSRSG